MRLDSDWAHNFILGFDWDLFWVCSALETTTEPKGRHDHKSLTRRSRNQHRIPIEIGKHPTLNFELK